MGGGGTPQAPGGKGGGGVGRRIGWPSLQRSARRSASRATSCKRSRWEPGSTQRRTSNHRAVAHTSTASGTAVH